MAGRAPSPRRDRRSSHDRPDRPRRCSRSRSHEGSGRRRSPVAAAVDVAGTSRNGWFELHVGDADEGLLPFQRPGDHHSRRASRGADQLSGRSMRTPRSERRRTSASRPPGSAAARRRRRHMRHSSDQRSRRFRLVGGSGAGSMPSAARGGACRRACATWRVTRSSVGGTLSSSARHRRAFVPSAESAYRFSTPRATTRWSPCGIVEHAGSWSRRAPGQTSSDSRRENSNNADHLAAWTELGHAPLYHRYVMICSAPQHSRCTRIRPSTDWQMVHKVPGERARGRVRSPRSCHWPDACVSGDSLKFEPQR